MSLKIWNRISLRTKLLTGFVAVTLVGGGMSNVLIDRGVESATRAAFEDRLSYEATMLGQMTASALFGEVDPHDESLKVPVRLLGESVHTQLSILSKEGALVADSLDGPTGRAPIAPDPEIAAAQAAGQGKSYRDGRLYVARAIVRDGAVLGFARSSVPETEIAVEVNEVRTRSFLGGVAGLVLALLVGVLLSASLVRPIRALSAGARRVGGGDFAHRISVESEDDIGKLAASFNEMTGNLEKTVAVLDKRNVDMQRVLDNVDQALLTLDSRGIITKERSATVSAWFGPLPEGTRFLDVLARVDAKTATSFEVEWEELCSNIMPIGVLLDQLPKSLSLGERKLGIVYSLIGAAEGAGFPEVLLIITDVTARLAADRAEAEQRELAAVFERTMRDRGAILEFLIDAESRVRLLTSELRPSLVETRRNLHTLKGNAASCGMQLLAGLCHTLETHMAEDGPDLSKADRSELGDYWTRVVARISTFIGDEDARIVIDDEEYGRVLRALVEASPRSEILRMVHDWRRERVTSRLGRLAASAQGLATRLHKGNILVDVAKSTLRTPREEWAPFWAALTHVVRNAVDHGLESREERALAGKLTPARLSLSAGQVESDIVITIADNGRGVDWARIGSRAYALGMPW
jgi:HAMP domain-containing protein/HPt (histidine-containing phosphotransfer) domain-containing protein